MRRISLVFVASFFCMKALALEITPYVGLNAQMRWQGFQKGYGHENFASKMPQGEVIAGFKVNPYLGFEVGYLRTAKTSRTATIYNPAMLLGNPSILESAGSFETNTTSSRIDGGSLSVVGFVPVTEGTELIGSVGIARLRVKLKYAPIANEDGAFSAATVQALSANFLACRYVPQAKIGIQHMLTSSLGLKALVGWEGTKNFNLLTNKQAFKLFASLKDSYNVGLGLAWYFN